MHRYKWHPRHQRWREPPARRSYVHPPSVSFHTDHALDTPHFLQQRSHFYAKDKIRHRHKIHSACSGSISDRLHPAEGRTQQVGSIADIVGS